MKRLVRWWYRLALRAYPKGFRDEYGAEMSRFFRDRLDAAWARGPVAVSRCWASATTDAVRSGLAERMRSHDAGSARGVWRELRLAARRLRRVPAYTSAAVLTLGLGIGATTAIYSVVHHVVIEPLPYPSADRLVALSHSAPGADIAALGVSYGTYLHYRELSRSLDGLAIYHNTTVTIDDGDDPDRVRAAYVTGSFFDLLLGGGALLGRPVRRADEAPGARRIVVLSHRMWRQRYGSAPDVVGRTVEINGSAGDIVGVLPASFDFPSPDTDVWIQIYLDESTIGLGRFNAMAVGRLAPDATLASARAELAALIPRLAERFPGPAFDVIVVQSSLTAQLQSLKNLVVGGDVERMLWVILATMGFVLLTGCANVLNLTLARAAGLRRDVAVRSALGASRGDLTWLFLSEGTLLALVGTTFGVGIAYVGIEFLEGVGPDRIPRLHEVALSQPILVCAATACLVTALGVGLIPLGRVLGPGPASTLDEASRGNTMGRRSTRLRDALAVSQVALALTLLVGAGLMARSFAALSRVDSGFDAHGAMTFRVTLLATDYPERDAAVAFQQELIDRLARIPGVLAAGGSDCLPLDCASSVNPLTREDFPLTADQVPPAVQLRTATPGFFAAARIPLVEGRMLERADHERRTGAAVVSRTLAERFWPAASALGKRVYPELAVGLDLPWYHIVGVVADTPMENLGEPPEPVVYFPLRGTDDRMVPAAHSVAYVVRTELDPESLVPQIRAALRELDPGVPVTEVRTLEAVVAEAEAPMRFAAVLLALAAGMATTLAAVGIYGVLSYTVSERQAEIGVRLALGARVGQVQAAVLGHGAAVAGLGVAIGLTGAALLSRLITSLLFEVSGSDPLTYLGVAVLLIVVAVAACAPAAWRAGRLDPVSSLHAE